MPVSVSIGDPTYFRPSLLARLAVTALLMLPITVRAHFGLGVDVKRMDLLEVFGPAEPLTECDTDQTTQLSKSGRVKPRNHQQPFKVLAGPG